MGRFVCLAFGCKDPKRSSTCAPRRPRRFHNVFFRATLYVVVVRTTNSNPKAKEQLEPSRNHPYHSVRKEKKRRRHFLPRQKLARSANGIMWRSFQLLLLLLPRPQAHGPPGFFKLGVWMCQLNKLKYTRPARVPLPAHFTQCQQPIVFFRLPVPPMYYEVCCAAKEKERRPTKQSECQMVTLSLAMTKTTYQHASSLWAIEPNVVMSEITIRHAGRTRHFAARASLAHGSAPTLAPTSLFC